MPAIDCLDMAISPATQQAIAAIRQLSAQRPYDPRALMQLVRQNPSAVKNLLQPHSLHLPPQNILVQYWQEIQNKLPLRHLVVSLVDQPGRYLPPFLLAQIASQFGFGDQDMVQDFVTTDNNDQAATHAMLAKYNIPNLFVERASRGLIAVHLFQVITME